MHAAILFLTLAGSKPAQAPLPPQAPPVRPVAAVTTRAQASCPCGDACPLGGRCGSSCPCDAVRAKRAQDGWQWDQKDQVWWRRRANPTPSLAPAIQLYAPPPVFSAPAPAPAQAVPMPSYGPSFTPFTPVQGFGFRGGFSGGGGFSSGGGGGGGRRGGC